jgi:ADP-heptose:LPS heptosyltransferase
MTDTIHHPVRYPAWKVAAARLAEIAVWPLAAMAPPPRGLDAVRRILIFEPFRLGDAALLHGMFGPLRDRFPRAEIHLLLDPCAAALYAGHADVACIHACPFPWVNSPGARAGWGEAFRFLRGLRGLRFDLGIDPRGDVRSQAALALAGCAARAGFTNYLASNVRIRGTLLTRNAGDLPLMHRVALHDAVLALLGCRPADAPVRIQRRAADGRVRVVISTGAGWTFRLWPEDRWAEVLRWLADRPGVEIRLIGTAEELPRLNRIRTAAGVDVAACVTDLPALLGELESADLVVCPDSAVMHLASEWFGLPVLALFGPGVVPLYRPRSSGSVVFDAQRDYPCAPCTQQRCVRPRDPCMSAMRASRVLADLDDRLCPEAKPGTAGGCT